MDLHPIVERLRERTCSLQFEEPVAHVYAPLDYARDACAMYIDKHARHGVRALLLGMNPGPWGMAQTGVPFGEVAHVRDFLGIECPVGKPRNEHPKRPVLGFECPRSEVSGRRLWGWAQERYGSPEPFFKTFFVWNWCPLAFLEEGGRNRTPDKLRVSERGPLEEACDEALRAVVEALEPEMVIGVGAFARKRAEHALGDGGPSFGTILHPSPASPAANRGWAPQAEAQLQDLGIQLPERSSASAQLAAEP